PEDPVVAFEHQPQRNRRERQQGELERRRLHPRVAAGTKHDRVREDDESGPRNRGVPRPERLDLRERGRLGYDHDREADPDRLSSQSFHVTRTRNEQPRSAGVPTPLPRINTLWVLPRPPGITSVFT